MVDFGGWEMPVQYTSIIEEHTAVRTSIGLFDIAHMGRLAFSGPDACRLIDSLVTNDIESLGPGRVCYALVCRDDGGILDDVLVYRFQDDYLLVVNASNRLKIVEWIESHRAGFDVEVVDRTVEWAMVAVQGPGAVDVVAAVTDIDVATMGYYRCESGTVLGHPARVSRTGYTGEDGFELLIGAEHLATVWAALADVGQAQGLSLGAFWIVIGGDENIGLQVGGVGEGVADIATGGQASW